MILIKRKQYSGGMEQQAPGRKCGEDRPANDPRNEQKLRQGTQTKPKTF